MSNVISIDFTQGKKIDFTSVQQSCVKLSSGLISPPREEVQEELAEDHTSEPIKSMDDIIRISEYLISHRRWRDNMMFIIGINFGLRVSDLLTLRFSHLINDDFSFKASFAILEKKTKNTRKVKKNRYITINTAVMEAVTLYLKHTPNVCLSDYLFRSESNNGYTVNKPLSRKSVDCILKGIASDLNLNIHVSTHTLRKTFAYHQMMMSGNDPRKLLLLQKMFGHSTSAMTLDYIGITAEEMEDSYFNLNLGSATKNYLVNSVIMESDVVS